MSVSNHVYVGPYLSVRSPVTVMTTDLCASHNRPIDDAAEALVGSSMSRHNSMGFCPVCGRIQAERVNKNRSSADDVYWSSDVFMDRLVAVLRTSTDTDDSYMAIPNLAGYGRRYLDPNVDSGSWTLPDTPEALQELTTEYAKDIAALRSCGCSVQVCMGVLCYST